MVVVRATFEIHYHPQNYFWTHHQPFVTFVSFRSLTINHHISL